jgi:hypothetical protein
MFERLQTYIINPLCNKFLEKNGPISERQMRLFENSINWVLFFLGTIPLWFFHEFVKVFFIFLKKSIKHLFFKYFFFANS